MRIGIDARELCGRSTGAGRYLSGLLAQWSANEKARPHDFVLYAPEPLGVAYDVHRFPTRIVPGSGGSWWEQVRLPSVAARDRLDVFFAPAYTAPLFLRVPTVVAIHDLSFAAHPEWFSTREGIPAPPVVAPRRFAGARRRDDLAVFMRRAYRTLRPFPVTRPRDSTRDHATRVVNDGGSQPATRLVRRIDFQPAARAGSDSRVHAELRAPTTPRRSTSWAPIARILGKTSPRSSRRQTSSAA